MLRFLYRCVLRAHPGYFRQRFADEMMSVFDQTRGRLDPARLLVDGVISLLRQWGLRSEFWDAPAGHVIADGAPLFYTFENPKPRTTALVYGALLSALVLNGVCWAMGYAWNHPRFMDIRPGYGPAGRVPESKLISRSIRRSTVAAEPPLSIDAGRVLLVFKSPAHAHSAAQPSGEATAGQALYASPGSGIDLQSYAGTYVTDSASATSVLITVEDGKLRVEVPREFQGFFLPESATTFIAVDVPDCRVEFATNGDGTVHRLVIYKGGLRITALRR